VLPGTWLAFALLDRRTPTALRWALAIACAPAVIAVAVPGASLAGLPFARAAIALAALSLLPPALSLAARREAGAGAPGIGWPTVLWTALLAALVVPLWLWVPDFRIYGWHNMMQLAAAYQLVDLPALPEERDLAGFRMNYPSLGHAQLTAIARLLGVSPTLVFPLLNLLHLAAFFALLEGAVARVARSRDGTAAATAVFLLATGLFGMLWSVAPPALGFEAFAAPLVGEVRIAPPISKFLYVDSMVVGLDLFAALVYVATLASGESLRRAWLAIPGLALAIGLVYPLLFPGACLVALGFSALCASGRRVDGARYPASQQILLAAGTLLACAVSALQLRILSGAGAAALPVRIAAARSLPDHVVGVAVALGPWIALAIPILCRGLVARAGPILLLAAAAAGSGLSYLALRLPAGTQYKFLFASALCLAPLSAAGMSRPLGRLGSRHPALAGLLLVGLCGVVESFLLLRHVPWEVLRRAPRLSEASFGLEPGDAAEAAWVRAVRDRTPAATILAAGPSRLPLAVLTQRSLYLAVDAPSFARPGYSLPADFTSARLRGYPRAAIERRRSTLRRALLGPADPDYPELTRELLALERPVALVFERPGAPYLAWLRERGPGVELARDRGTTIWLVPASPAPAGHAAAAAASAAQRSSRGSSSSRPAEGRPKTTRASPASR
jgi:hypothetical protein